MSEEIPKWAQELTTKVDSLAEQIGKNCNKLDTVSSEVKGIKEKTDLIPQVLEIVQANGQGIEVISERVDKLEVKSD